MTKVFNIRLTDEQHSQIKRLADEYGETMTGFILRMLDYVEEKKPKFEFGPKRKTGKKEGSNG